MGEDFLDKLFGNSARARLVRIFIFNSSESFTLAKAAKRAGISNQAAGKELKSLEQLGIVKKGKHADHKRSSHAPKNKKSRKVGRVTKPESTWLLNAGFKHLRALSSFIHEVSPIRYDNIADTLKSSCRLSAVIVSGCFVGDPTRPVDLIVVAENINGDKLEHAIKMLEPLAGSEIRYASFSTPEFRYLLTIQDRLIRDTLDYPHQVLLDRKRLL